MPGVSAMMILLKDDGRSEERRKRFQRINSRLKSIYASQRSFDLSAAGPLNLRIEDTKNRRDNVSIRQ
jgi:hypothetical protein